MSGLSLHWEEFLDANGQVPGLMAAVLHATRLGLSPADCIGITGAIHDAAPDDQPRLNFNSARVHCDVSPTRCRLYGYAPGVVEFDADRSPHFNMGRQRC